MFTFLTNTASSSIPSWAFGLVIGIITSLATLLAWFVRREFHKIEKETDKIQRFEKEIESFQQQKTSIEKIQGVLFGQTDNSGFRVSKGLVETIKEVSEDLQGRKKTWDAWEQDMDNFIAKFDEISKNQEKLSKRIEQSENWKQEDSKKLRQSIKELEKRHDLSSQDLSEIKGKLDVLIKLLGKEL